jgi:DNA polymerase-3 subunit gamma/tau
MVSWAHVSTQGGHKIAIIENADLMHEASRNALLKLLEEPPPGVYLVLLTTRRSAIVPTIASRLRPYDFAARNTEDTRDVLRRIFREEQLEYSSMREYFVKTSLEQAETLEELARRFLQAAMDGRSDIDVLYEVEGAVQRSDRRDALRYFSECILGRLKRQLEAGTKLETVERWSSLLHQARFRAESLNIGTAAVLESLFYQMRKTNCESSSNER